MASQIDDIENLMRNCNDQLVPKPHSTSHMTWESADDTSKKSLETYGDSVDGGHNKKRQHKMNKIGKGQSSHPSNAFLEHFSGESECFDQAKAISDAIFQFQTSLTRAVHISNMTKTLPTVEGMLEYKVVGDARMPLDGLVNDDHSASEISSSCHFPLINSQAIETNGYFEGEYVVGKDYDFLEHSWDRINNLSNLEDVDSIIQDPLFQNIISDVDMGSPIQTSFPGMQCKSTPITLKSEVFIRNEYGCLQSELESIKIGDSFSLEEHIADPYQVSQSQHYGAGDTYKTVTNDLVDEGTTEAVVLNQLKAVTMQLNLRTRIYIRDALYRLARNANQRHAVTEAGITPGVCGESSNSRTQLKQELHDPSRYNGISLVETETNPTDRCIAELLFCKRSSHSSINAPDKHLLSSFDVETKAISYLGTSGLTQEREGQEATVASPYFARKNPTDSENESKVKAGLHLSATRTSSKGLQCTDIYQTSGSNLFYPRGSNCFDSCLGFPYFELRQETPNLYGLSVDTLKVT